MITEPEMWGEPEPSRPADLLSDEDHRPASRAAARRRQWVWAVGGIAAASVTWTAVLQGIGYGHPQAPDLHGYRLTGLPCTATSLEPLADSIAAGSFTPDIATPPHLGPALDRAACTATSYLPIGAGWNTEYTVSVTVELHKRTDPRAEFQDIHGPAAAAGPAPHQADGTARPSAPGAVTRRYPGIGDLAYATGSATRQTLDVLHGGAVISLTVDAVNSWNGVGDSPVNADGTPRRPPLVDTTALRPLLVATVRHLMDTLARS